ncbi:MAG: rRNA maturation RNase YbeY [Lysobacterales bacterium]
MPGDDQFRLWIDAVPTADKLKYILGIRIVDEQEAQRFNREYRNRDYATNVLSFPAELPEGLPAELRRSHLGDLLICAPVVAREAIEQNRPEADHWAHLTIHGLMHLLGYDHEQPDEALAMESMETEILANLGISDPYVDIA